MDLLTLSNVSEFFHGILDLHIGNQGISVRRFTERQLTYYDQAENWAIRARCPASVVLTLRTDSPMLDVDITVEQGARPYFGLDLEVDGAFVRAWREDPFPDGGRFSERVFDTSGMPRQMRTLRLYLHHSRPLRWHHIHVEDGACVEPVARPDFKLLCLGDSITQGMDAVSAATTYVLQLARLLPADVLNQGVGGHVFDVASLDPDLPFVPDMVTVAYGTNDWNRDLSLDDIRANVTAYVSQLRAMYPQVPIVVMTPLYRPDYAEAKYGRDLLAWSHAIAEAARVFPHVRVVDGFTLVPHHAENYRNPVHPNELGFMHYALNLYREI